MTTLAKQRIAFAAAAFVIFAVTSLTISIAAHSREAQISELPMNAAAGAQLSRLSGVKSSLTADDEGRFSFPTTVAWKGQKTNIQGTLTFPDNASGQVPLVVIVHSADGIDAAETGWASYWREQGYASFLLDYMAPRNADQNGRDIPRSPYDIADALTVLATHPRIDTKRVAVQGLSNGATMTVSAAGLVSSMAHRIGIMPRAFIMLYGGCHFNLMAESMADAAYLFMVGDKDTLIPAGLCTAKEDLTAKHGKDVHAVVLAGAHHGFDGTAVEDFQHRRFGHVVIQPNRPARDQARAAASALLQRVFAGG